MNVLSFLSRPLVCLTGLRDGRTDRLTADWRSLWHLLYFIFKLFIQFQFILLLLQLRKAQDEIGELQTVNDHLQKRFDKLKSKRKDDT